MPAEGLNDECSAGLFDALRDVRQQFLKQSFGINGVHAFNRADVRGGLPGVDVHRP